MVFGRDLIVGTCYESRGEVLGKFRRKDLLGPTYDPIHSYVFENRSINTYDNFDNYDIFEECVDISDAERNIRVGQCYTMWNQYLGNYLGRNNTNDLKFSEYGIVSRYDNAPLQEVPCRTIGGRTRGRKRRRSKTRKHKRRITRRMMY
jgi:hypothetical protein